MSFQAKTFFHNLSHYARPGPHVKCPACFFKLSYRLYKKISEWSIQPPQNFWLSWFMSFNNLAVQCTVGNDISNRYHKSKKKFFCFSSDFDETWRSFSTTWVLKLLQVSSKSDEKQKFFICSLFMKIFYNSTIWAHIHWFHYDRELPGQYQTLQKL